MKYGYVLLEILISTLIASILATGLLMSIVQVNQLQQTIGSLTATYGKIAILKQQLERDIMGAFVPTQVDMIQTQTGKKESQKKPLADVFEGVSKADGGRLDYLTFITNNPLEIFFGVKNSKLKPRVARVVYRLIPDEKRKNSYRLLRQEGTSVLAFANYKEDAQGEARAYAMIDGIQAFSVEFMQIEERKEKEAKKPTYVYKTSSQWKSIKKDEKQEAKPAQKKQTPRPQLPQWVTFKVALWDIPHEKHRECILTIPLAAQEGNFEKIEEKKEAAEDKKPAPEGASPAAKSETPQPVDKKEAA